MTKKEYMLQELKKSKKIRKLYDDYIIKEVAYEDWVERMMNSMLKDCSPEQWEELLKPVEHPPSCDACGERTTSFMLKASGDRWCKKCTKAVN